MAINYINNESEDFFHSDNYLTRILTLDRFIEFQENKFVFISPEKWSDPYEKAFLQAKYQYNGNTYIHPLKPVTNEGYNLFAQCWSAGKQTEALWKGFAPHEDIDGFSKAATIAEVQKQDYKLTPGIYVGAEVEEDDGIPFEEKMEALKEQLMTQFEKSEELKQRILTNFEKI